ncbi:MAG TPA: imidazole glycerol phosphate synthase subunit HisH, partial [Candidatus Methanomethylia archaeon]|nr:imidazole glycerol phosphate synthase subunit HisH [Candidatus Methanomethylicia archaeon]
MSRGEVRVAIINYGMGNLLSIATSLSRVGAQPAVINSINEAENFDAVVFPGVGAFKPAMAKLAENHVLVKRILEEKPVLGICLGMQLFYEGSEEGCSSGCFVEGLKVFKGYVRRLPNIVKVPHMGWNSIKVVKDSCPLFEDIPSGIYVYYAHSYATPPSE